MNSRAVFRGIPKVRAALPEPLSATTGPIIALDSLGQVTQINSKATKRDHMPRFGSNPEDKLSSMRARQMSAPTPPPMSEAACLEPHLCVAEIADRWGLSPDAVRKLFEREPGVIVLGGSRAGKRRYTTLRIPLSVVERVHRRLQRP